MNLILALGTNCELGYDKEKDYKLFWNQKADLKRFKDLTENNIVVMGYNTYLSIGKELSNRHNIVLDRTLQVKNSLSTIKDVLNYCKTNLPDKEIFIIGGKKIFEEVFETKEYFDLIDKIYLTEIHTPIWSFIPKEEKKSLIQLDRRYRTIIDDNFLELITEFNLSDKNNQFNYTFKILEKI